MFGVSLIASLKQALKELTPDDETELDLEKFAKKDSGLIMNASYTKIYSLLSGDPFVIYDSRVSVAIGLIVKKYWLAKNIEKALPEFLSFRYLEGRSGNSRCANDNNKNIIFKIASNDKDHALWNVRANWVIEAALKRAGIEQGELIKKMRSLEAALFMIGYSV